MDELIEALSIFLKYGNPSHPTHCEYDELTVLIDPKKVHSSDIAKLEKLGFHAKDDHFYSFRFGSA